MEDKYTKQLKKMKRTYFFMTVCVYLCIFAALYIAVSMLFTMFQLNPYVQAAIMIVLLILDVYLTGVFMREQILKKWMQQ